MSSDDNPKIVTARSYNFRRGRENKEVTLVQLDLKYAKTHRALSIFWRGFKGVGCLMS